MLAKFTQPKLELPIQVFEYTKMDLSFKAALYRIFSPKLVPVIWNRSSRQTAWHFIRMSGYGKFHATSRQTEGDTELTTVGT